MSHYLVQWPDGQREFDWLIEAFEFADQLTDPEILKISDEDGAVVGVVHEDTP